MICDDLCNVFARATPSSEALFSPFS
jgi:hypothetical protein